MQRSKAAGGEARACTISHTGRTGLAEHETFEAKVYPPRGQQKARQVSLPGGFDLSILL
jgi:hypothetical protein